MEFSEPTRRRALWALGAAGLAALGAADGVRDGAPSPARAVRPVARPRGLLHPPVVPPTQPPAQPPAPLPGRPGWHPVPVPPRHQAVINLKDLGPPPRPRAIALTIDDGPHPEWTPQVLDLLAEHQVTATFFIIGEMVKEYPRLAKRIAEAGHLICNHTMTHPIPFDRIGGRRITSEIREAHARIADATGVTPKFFRSPGGAWSHRVFETVAEWGMIPIGWEVDPQDWRRPGVGHIRRTMMESKAGAIMLCHDGGGDRSQTLRALRTVLPKMKQRGLTFVPL